MKVASEALAEAAELFAAGRDDDERRDDDPARADRAGQHGPAGAAGAGGASCASPGRALRGEGVWGPV